MTTATEQLQAIADAWAKSLGGGIEVGLVVHVTAGPRPAPVSYVAHIGRYDMNGWHSFGSTPEATESEAERRWKLDGSPTDPKDAERAKLWARAAELGLRVVEDTPNTL